ncbi:bifunctional Zinc finger [Babesia duncani]|uniref:Bifunctional Zinc finger n=1 Tax=Babesia duncani TaxID=323732 RepID=A0AAD9PKH6_9APIC|nr:bifunctional Zinc finger [Babesia duncani]
MAPRRNWCKLCQDDYRSGDVIIRCQTCPKSFHRECIEHDIATSGYFGAEYDVSTIDLANFKCENCLRFVDENAIENDERCKLCKERNRDDNDVLLLCDGCPNSYHMSCLDLHAEPDEEQWFCPMCRPEDFKAINVRESRRNPLSESADHVNSSICYVCQRHGKLLGCDFCSNSFHHGCLPEFDVGTIGDVWECPCCKGEDPFINQMHKRWTIQQIEKNIKDRRKCILLWKSKISRYRTRFLLAHRKDLAPFVSDKTMATLQRFFLDEDSGSRKRLHKKARTIEDLLESFEEEASIEADNFILKAHKSCYYPSGRRIDARPLRAGVSLKPHQEDGVDWLLKSYLTGGAILSDEMGLGKTIQTLCFLSYLKLMKIDGPHLIVVPLSTVGNWLREVHRFTPHLTCIKICGSITERSHAMEDRLAYKGLYDLYITTYETVKNEEAFFVETIPRWQCLILDEAHRIKNAAGAVRHSMDRVQANMRLLLTGTPLQNNAMELFTLINFMFPDIFKGSTIIDEAFNNTKNKRGMAMVDSNFKREDLESIKLLLSKIMLRRLKEQAIILPNKIFHDIWLPLSKDSLHWYRTLMNLRSLMKENVSIKKLLGLVIKMRIVCGHPRAIVSRPYQTDKLFEFFKQEEINRQEEIEAEAETLRALKCEEHIWASAKLTFLDKLLQQLHYENCDLVQGYTSKFNAHLKELKTSAEHKKKLRKRAESSQERQRQIEAENPFQDFRFIHKAEPTASDRHFLASGLYPITLEQDCPYQRMHVINQADIRERIRKQQQELVASASAFDETGEVAENGAATATRSRVLLSDDEDGEKNPAGEVKIKQEPDSLGVAQGPSDVVMAEPALVSIKSEPPEPQTSQRKSQRPVKTELQATATSPRTGGRKKKPVAMMHKVLIFTQFQLVLDELESYCNCRGWKYMRLDGSTNKLIRELDIREFNSPNSPYFVYLISTRAGGLGINLTAANHVVLFDEDWNPFIDLQAIDRAHRIGQLRNVHIWKLISEWTVEERMALRREQKLRLDKLLVNANHGELEDASEAPILTLSPAAIVKMMMHGNKAIQNLDTEPIIDKFLDDLVSRGRKRPPEELDDMVNESALVEEIENEIKGADQDPDAMFVDVSVAMQDEEQPEATDSGSAESSARSTTETEGDSIGSFIALFNGNNMLDVRKVKKLLATRDDREELLKQLQNAGLLWRSERERKRPNNMYTPDTWRKRTEIKPIRHETKCFCCGYPKNYKTSYKDKNGERQEIDYGELMPCFRCPKSYHKFCERLGDVRKTWTCRWHECCLCFRKSSQCDNLLIHCSNCPTSFCYDCFPPDYTRHYVGEDYYYSLTQRGMNANSQNWIFFLCSKCKISQERDRRRKLTREEREKQQKQQKELRSQLISNVAEVEPGKRTREERKIYVEAQKSAEIEMESRLRDAYQDLFSPNLIAEIARRIEDARIKREADDRAGLIKTKREVTFLSTRLPGRMLSLCENCRLPLHNTYRHPGECPYPKELVKLENVLRQEQEVKQLSPPPPGPDAEVSNDPQVASGTAIPLGEEQEKPASPQLNPKIYKRTACAKCYQVSTGKLSHQRRHCDMLTIQEQREYQERRSKLATAISKLQAQKADPNQIDYSRMSHTKLKTVYTSAIDQADAILLQVLKSVQLPTGSTADVTNTHNLEGYISSPNICKNQMSGILPPLVLPPKLNPPGVVGVQNDQDLQSGFSSICMQGISIPKKLN